MLADCLDGGMEDIELGITLVPVSVSSSLQLESSSSPCPDICVPGTSTKGRHGTIMDGDVCEWGRFCRLSSSSISIVSIKDRMYTRLDSSTSLVFFLRFGLFLKLTTKFFDLAIFLGELRLARSISFLGDCGSRCYIIIQIPK